MGSKILVVGCGGLGCELVKLLVLDTSNDITLIDDDTIDSTNLNRQFFFVRDDVNKSKSEVVAKKLSMGKEQFKITSIQDKIDNYKIISFYKQFDVVYNCLDNDAARSFVNQRCYLADVLLIDGGSAGWLGQSFCNKEECFDCIPKQIEKDYPICSIRQQPKIFEHCLVWGKALIEKESTLKGELEELSRKNGEDARPESTSTDDINDKVDVTMERVDGNKNVKNINEDVIHNQIKTDVINDEVSLDNSNTKKISLNNTVSSSEDSELLIIQKDLIVDEELTNKKPKTTPFEFNLTRFLFDLDHTGDTVEKIYKLACLKAKKYGITPFSLTRSQTFIKKIIPSICTTNSIVASLMIISKIELKNFYLVQGSIGILRVDPTKKNKNCTVCSLPTYQATIKKDTLVSSFLIEFDGESLINENVVYDKDSDASLNEYDGYIMLCMRNDQPNRIYFEIGSEQKTIRLK